VRALTSIRRFLTGSIPLVAFLFVSIVRAGFATYMSYVAPWDIMQDVVSVQQLLKGGSAYPADIESMIEGSLKRDPPAASLGRWSSGLRQKEIRESGVIPSVQAHPPFLLILTVPMVAMFGSHGTALGVDLLSLAGLCLVLVLISKSGAVQWARRIDSVVFIAILGWEPTLSLLRYGQSGLLIALLVISGWLLLRRGHAALAGVPLGLATCLKLYPGLVLVYLLFRHRRALVTALITILVLSVAPIPFTGWRIYSEYFSSARVVMNTFGDAPLNLSMLALLRRNGLPVRNAHLGLLDLASVSAVMWCLRRKPERELGEWFDLEYSLFLILMLLLSPITWDHYLMLLILPIVVLGQHVLNNRTSWTGLFGLCFLILLLSIPQGGIAVGAVYVYTASIFTLSLIAFAVWIAGVRMKTASSSS
jgi:hypothetical protein